MSDNWFKWIVAVVVFFCFWSGVFAFSAWYKGELDLAVFVVRSAVAAVLAVLLTVALELLVRYHESVYPPMDAKK